ncbi:MAG: 4Fe-4S dicluster domain-containing protein [Lachnospiraceae bacterium]|nr:4Fe-4S dicluster domain-containing protein [Lachnospiraceae bacterium]
MNMVEAIKSAGVVGAGGAGFPTHIKLNAKAECFLVNAAECEPLIETDKYLCRTYPDRIVETVVKIAEHLGAKRSVIALKDHYHSEIKALEQAIDRKKAAVEIFKMRSFYPAGDEQTLVYEVTGRSVPERGLPLDVGCVVDNVGTVLSIADALEEKPVMEKYLSVTGAVAKPVMFHAPIGTPIRRILQAADLKETKYAVILGGPMMGKMLRTDGEIDAAVVTKTTGNLLVLPKDHYLVRRSELTPERMIHQAATACIQCKMCTDLCPRYMIGHEVRPNMVMRSLWKEALITDEKEYKRCFGSAANCCSCGACEMFSCPMGLSPRKMNDYAKGLLRARGINVEKNTQPVARDGIEHHRIPTDRLIARLDLTRYVTHTEPELIEFQVDGCMIPFSQHIGKPAVPKVSVGDHVAKGDLVASAAEGGLSANIHTGMAGVVTEVTDRGIVISGKEE